MKRTGNSAQVIAAFEKGEALRTPKAPVPGGSRVEATYDEVQDPDFGPLRRGVLFSYRTEVAYRPPERDRILVTTKRYSVTTSKLLGHLRRHLARRGWVETQETQEARAAVPGRWGGFGPAWASSPVQTLPFQVWVRDEDHEADPETHDIVGPTSAEVLADLPGAIIAYESGELGEDATITLFQHLVDTGLAWSLQGSYGRAAQAFIEQGLVTAP